MKILYFERTIAPYQGGVQRVTWIISKYLEVHGHECFYAYCDDNYDGVDDKHKLKYSSQWDNFTICRFINEYIKENKIDLFINQGYFDERMLRICRTIKSNTDCYIISCLHLAPNFLEFNRKYGLKDKFKKVLYEAITGYNYTNRYIRMIYSLSNYTTMLSETFRNDFCTKANLKDTKRLIAISDPLSFCETLSVEDIEKKEKQVFWVARLQEIQKNATGALRIWKEIENRGYEDWTFILGGYGFDEEIIRKYAESLNLRHFMFAGRIDDPEPVYRKSSIFMMTSHMEGFGMTLTESLQTGCVPVAFDTFTALHDIVSDGYNGIIVPAGDEYNYADKVERLMINDELRKSMAKNAIESSGKFSVETIGKQWLCLINNLQK